MRGDEMRALREAAGLSQLELAGLLGVAKNTVARWERGERPILRTTELATRHVLGDMQHAPGSGRGSNPCIRQERNDDPSHRLDRSPSRLW